MSDPTGACLCGATTYTAHGASHKVSICHCGDCLRWSGGPFIGIEAERLTIEGSVHWFSSSDWAERGSCSTCGSALFWRLKDGSHASCAAGTLHDQSAMSGVSEHIFSDRKPAYYDFKDDAPRYTAEETIARFMEEMKAEDA